MQNESKLGKNALLKNIAITLAVLLVFAFAGNYYVQLVYNDLWDSNVRNAYLLTLQGRNNLQRQLLKDYQEANLIKQLYANDAENFPKENINGLLGKKNTNKRRFMIVAADTKIAADIDVNSSNLLQDYGKDEQGILPVHISNSTGLRVLDIYVRGKDKQGHDFYVLKEFDIRDMAKEFLPSFHDGQGFSYVVDKEGRILLRQNHPNSNKTMQNFFDTVDKDSSSKVKDHLLHALANNENGWTEVKLNGEENLLCYATMDKSLGWTIISLIPSSVINAAAEKIIRETFVLLFVVAVGMLVLVIGTMVSYNRYQRLIAEQGYRNHWFETLSQNSQNVFLIYDSTTKHTEYVFANIYRVLGIERERVQQDLLALCDIAVEESLRSVLQKVKDGSLEHYDTATFSYRNDYRNEVRQANITILSLDDKGDPGKYIICLADCTEAMTIRQMLEDSLDEAQRSNQAKRIFLSNISHDVRTPLNGIMGLLAIIDKNIDNRPKLLECLGKLKTASQHMLELINQVLDMSRIESGRMSLNVEPMDLAELLQSSVSIVQPLANNKKHELKLAMELRHKQVLGDKTQLKQIFINLITNAIKYTANGGKISVELREKALDSSGRQLYELIVEDNGFGMSEEFQKHIFEPFSRVENSTTSGIQGTGLGMAILKRIVDLMQGNIELESELGKGSKFTVVLPFKLVEEPLPEAPAPEPVEDESLFAGKHALLVDDVELNREIAEFMLSNLGLSVTCLEDGKNAVLYMQNAHPGDVDIILMDIMMPNMDGYTAARLIRNISDKNVANTPIIALTANAFEETKREVLAAGMNGHLAKPINTAELVAALKSMLR